MFIVLQQNRDLGDYIPMTRVVSVTPSFTDALVKAWGMIIRENLKYDFYRTWWCDISKKSVNERKTYRGIGNEYEVIHWDLERDVKLVTWTLKKNTMFKEIGPRGEDRFKKTLQEWQDIMQRDKILPDELLNASVANIHEQKET